MMIGIVIAKVCHNCFVVSFNLLIGVGVTRSCFQFLCAEICAQRWEVFAGARADIC